MFCPKCGTPFLVVEKPKSEAQHSISQEEQEQKKETTNQTSTPPPPPNNSQRNTPPPVDKLTDMAEDFIKQGDKFLKETVDPHLDKGIDKLMETDWKSKVYKLNDAILHFDVKKVKSQPRIYAGIGCVVLFIGGLFFSLFMFIACNGCGHSNNSDDGQDIPKWLTEWKFVYESDTGGKMILRLNNNGTGHITYTDATGATLHGWQNGTKIDMSYDLTYKVMGNKVYLYANGAEHSVLEMESERHRLHTIGGGVFKQSAF